jgi:hypothetical protein
MSTLEDRSSPVKTSVRDLENVHLLDSYEDDDSFNRNCYPSLEIRQGSAKIEIGLSKKTKREEREIINKANIL